MNATLDTAGVIVPITDGEPILQHEEREITMLVAHEHVTVTHARYQARQWVAGPHVHHEHTDAFYVLEGELAFEIGRESETVIVSAGGFVAAPPGLAHSFGNDSDRPARWLTIHAPDGGFAAFMRGTRDHVEVEWDIAPVPAGGGPHAREAVVSPGLGDEHQESRHRSAWLRCALPDICVVEWCLFESHDDLPLRYHDHEADAIFVIEGELEATFAGTRHTVGPDTLITIPPRTRHTFRNRRPGRVRVLSLHMRERM